MREIVGTLAILGGLIEVVTAIGGPQMAGVGMVTRDVAAISMLAGGRIGVGGNGQGWGLGLVVAAVVGTMLVGPWTGFFTMGAGFTLLAGASALLIRRGRRPKK